jgi:hypothetical protein
MIESNRDVYAMVISKKAGFSSDQGAGRPTISVKSVGYEVFFSF